jgi:DNA-binding transcriptional LysR family regulator
MSRIDLNTLSQFAVVARHLNFRRAAAELAVAPSTLSERIRDLEDQLGVRLLNRTTRSASLTEEGQRLLDRTRDAITVLDETTGGLGSNQRDTALSGKLRINGPRPAVELRLMPLIISFLQQHPYVRIDVVSESELVDVVAAGFDAGVRYDEKLEQDMVAIKLGADQRMIIAATPSYLAQRGTPSDPDDLTDHDCIGTVFAHGNVLPWSLESGESRIDFTPSDRLHVTTIEVGIMAARASLGLVYTFEDYVADDLASGRMVTVLDGWTPPFAGPSLYFPDRRLMPAALRAFVDHVKAETRKNK